MWQQERLCFTVIQSILLLYGVVLVFNPFVKQKSFGCLLLLGTELGEKVRDRKKGGKKLTLTEFRI